jgi:hypothetical protein
LIGCRIADRSYQPGLLRIVRSIVHPGGDRCDRCRSVDPPRPRGNDLFWELLQAADRPWPALLLRALFDPMALKAFTK